MSCSPVAVVTGGASGIGFCFARALASSGHRVLIADIHDAGEAVADLRKAGWAASSVRCDVTRYEDAIQAVAAAQCEFGGVDILVNNAGLFTSLTPKPFEQIEPDEWMKVMEVNTLGPFNCAKAAVPVMAERGGGRIVNIASVAPLKGSPMMLHYVASKGAVIAFTRSLSRELGARKITVNAIAPGFTISDGVVRSGLNDVLGEAARHAGRSIVRDQVPADLTSALLFLVDEASNFITGQTIAVDGGSVFL